VTKSCCRLKFDCSLLGALTICLLGTNMKFQLLPNSCCHYKATQSVADCPKNMPNNIVVKQGEYGRSKPIDKTARQVNKTENYSRKRSPSTEWAEKSTHKVHIRTVDRCDILILFFTLPLFCKSD